MHSRLMMTKRANASLRRKIGVDFSRPEYTHADGLRALQRNGWGEEQ